MSLQIWLPLIGDLENKGIGSVNVINNGVTNVTGGKLGNCYQTGSSKYIKGELNYSWFKTAFSVSGWFKLNNITTTKEVFILGPGYGWNNIHFGLVIVGGTAYSNIANGSDSVRPITFSVVANTWYHYVFTYNAGQISVYLNGNLINNSNISITPSLSTDTMFGIGAAPNNGGEPSDGYVNDFRLYDHALSQLEVKEISQGLMAHYKLDKTAGEPIYNNTTPTFNTSAAGGAWSHWGSSTAAGTFGQNTDKQFIYDKFQTYSHWVANASTATTSYVVYQSPAFSGGYRSMQAIIKEENSKKITNDICYATWNARSGGLANNTWSSIESLGNGFYLCKAEGIMQDGSNNLIGIYVKPGYKIYISCIYIENDQQHCTYNCADLRTNISDSTGYGHDGNVIGTIQCYSDSLKYNHSLYFPATGTDYIETTCPSNFGTDDFTISCWVKIPTQTEGTYQAIVSSKAQSGASSGIAIYWNVTQNKFLWSTGDDSSSGEVWMATAVNNVVYDNWIHLVMIRNNSDTKKGYFYINGIRYELASTATIKDVQSTRNFRIGMFYGTSNYSSNMYCNDVRIYRTALSEEDILALYKTSARIDNFGNFHEYEVNELSAPNLVTGLTAGGRTTIIDNGRTVQTTGESADTYFTINLTESIVSGTSYTLSCIASGIPEGSYWRFPLGSQSNGSLPFDIYNGYNEYKFTANDISWGTNRLFMDDIAGPRTSVCKFSNFRLFKNDTSKVEVKQSGIVNASQFIEGSDKTRFFSGGSAYTNNIIEN